MGLASKKKGRGTMKGSKVVKARGLPWSATAEEVLFFLPSSQEIATKQSITESCHRWLNSSNPRWLRAVKMGFILRSTGLLLSEMSDWGIF